MVRSKLTVESRFRGCLLGGAVGDALGGAVEFLQYDEILQKHGPGGIRAYDRAYGLRGAITDDTQMTLFTAEGLLRFETRLAQHNVPTVEGMVWAAYLRWLKTQGNSTAVEFSLDGWLIQLKELWHGRAPGLTCVGALSSGRMGTPDVPINYSKGCGGVMRVAPVGLWASRQGVPVNETFGLAARLAAITHGHPSGYLSAGCLAASIQVLLDGRSMSDAVATAAELLATHPGHEECKALIERAHELAESPASYGNLRQLGEGWVGEEALAISYYCALTLTDDFEAAVVLAVNHSGDSDSTGAITGNLLGAKSGVSVIPDAWLEELELRSVIEQVALDLYKGYDDSDDWKQRYPGR